VFGFTPELADYGFLVGFGSSRVVLYRRSAEYVRKILDGAKPADLPVEQPTRFQLALNLKVARVIGLNIPQGVLLRADRLIE
jgi:putative ABC transport system substrate-binding protein